jgi:chorismate dehydratase
VVSTSLADKTAKEHDTRAALRLAAVSYLNAAPLVYGLEAEPRFDVLREVPSRVAERLHAGEADLGMIPSIEYARGDYAIVPEVAITSRGPVRSVNLFLRKPLQDVRRVAIDSGSRTSVALARLLLRERLGREPEYVAQPPDVPRMLERCEAALVIGDAALYYEGGAERIDLGEAWQALTGLPFVWAFWAGRKGALGAIDVARLQRAQAEGVRAIPEIARSWSGGDPARAALNEGYLRDNIAYILGAEERAGLREFHVRAHAAGLIPSIPEIRLYGRY